MAGPGAAVIVPFLENAGFSVGGQVALKGAHRGARVGFDEDVLVHRAPKPPSFLCKVR